RRWMDGARANDLPVLCSRWAQEDPFAAALTSPARHAAASRAGAASERFYAHCREQRPGSPRYQRDGRWVAYQQSGRQVEGEGKRIILTDGAGIGPGRLIGTRERAPFPREPIKRGRWVRRADGSYA